MILKTVQVKEFKSVWDSGKFEVDDITCLVGKNEAGKTAILQALYRLNPYIASDGEFDVTDDYPRSKVVDYEYDIENEKREPAENVKATFELEPAEISSIEQKFGPGALTSYILRENKGYEESTYGIEVDEKSALEFVTDSVDLPSSLKKELADKNSFRAAKELLEAQEQTSEVQELLEKVQTVTKNGSFRYHLYRNYIQPHIPKFLYFDDYYQMKGIENIEGLQQRVANKTLKKSDYPLLGLIRRARLKLEDLVNPERTQELKNKLQGASNYINRQVLDYWSQNKHIRLSFDVRPAKAGDPEGMREGTNIWAEVEDIRHQVTGEIGTRSKGFVWFFSFLAWYSDIKHENLILLLDEPGLSLHGRAQTDLLTYFDAEVRGHHQLIYTTHLPFMVNPSKFDRVRIVQDKGIDSSEPLPVDEEGTKVHDNILEASGDSLFPLQGAMGFDLYQSLFIGPNNLVVEGKSDLIYLQTMSSILMDKGREPLSPLWTVVPTGGDGRIYTMAPLLAAQNNLNVAVLVDYQAKDKQRIESLYTDKLLDRDHVITYADFLKQNEADIEDLFDASFYLDLINKEYRRDLSKDIDVADLNGKIPRIHLRLVQYFEENPLPKGVIFSHYRPARYFAQNLKSLKTPNNRTLDKFEDLFKKLNSLL